MTKMETIVREGKTERRIRALDATDIVQEIHGLEDERDALTSRLAEAERLLQWVDDQGRLDARDAFDFREMHAKYKTRATDSADLAKEADHGNV